MRGASPLSEKLVDGFANVSEIGNLLELVVLFHGRFSKAWVSW